MTECTILSVRGQSREALLLMEKAKEIFPDNKILKLTLSEMYFRERRYKEAYKELLFIKTDMLGLGLLPIDTKDVAKVMMQLLIVAALAVGDFDTVEHCISKLYNDPNYKVYRG